MQASRRPSVATLAGMKADRKANSTGCQFKRHLFCLAESVIFEESTFQSLL
jgi:hypothetical protein